MKLLCRVIAASLMMIFSVIAEAADFVLRDYLGHSWTNERVTFTLSPDQEAMAVQNMTLIGPDNQEIQYQLLSDLAQGEHRQISFQSDLSPFEQRAFRFTNRSSTVITDLKIEETASELRIGNELVGLAIRKSLLDGQGPIAGVRLRNGLWTGGSSLRETSAVKNYTVRITGSGPVFMELHCRLVFAEGGEWNLHFRIESGEPLVLIEEDFDTPRGGSFQLDLGSESYRPTHVLYRSGKGGKLGQLQSQITGSGKAFLLEPWLHWWEAERQGNWFALYTEGAQAASENEMLMIGLLRPSEWKDPDWTGKAPHVELRVPAQIEHGLVALTFPLGGGNRVWMLGTPDEKESVTVLEEKNRKVSPLPQRYLIKHGDFPLDVVKDYVLEWDGDHDNYPRLFVNKQDLPALRDSLESDPRQLKRWEKQQAIDKYNIDDPLREYFASGSAVLGDKIIGQSSQWLNMVVHEDLLLQNSRVTLGVAPHAQAVLLLPTINLSDAALGIESLSTELRQQLLAKLAFLAYAVNRDDYWSPARGFAANPNMTTTVAQFQVALASLIPSHPMAQEWADRGLATLSRQLLEWSDEDGGWLEAPHYAVVAYDHMLAAFIMAARAGFANYVYEERMRKVVEWLARISTPRDAHTEGFRHLPPIGNTYFGESTGLFCIIAGLWQERDPQFAGQMQWMCEEHGSPDLGLGWSFPSMAGYKDLLMAHGTAPERPDYGSTWFRETGVVLRNRIGSEHETWLHLIAGSNHEHYDHDSGSIVLWGKGRILADDWGYIGRHGQEFHSLLSSFVARGTMRITDFSSQPAFDYVAGNKGAWQRQIGFVKDNDPLGPNFFLIRDTHHLEFAAEWRLWLSASPNPDAIRFHSRGVTVTGLDDVDFDLFFYQPESLDLKTETVTQKTTVGNRNGKVEPMTMRQTALIASLEDRGSVTLLVYPRLRSEAPPNVIWHADGHIAEVISTAGTDYVSVTARTKPDELEEHSVSGNKGVFRGDAGSVRIRSSNVTLTLGSPGSIRFGDETLSGEVASSKKISLSHP